MSEWTRKLFVVAAVVTVGCAGAQSDGTQAEPTSGTATVTLPSASPSSSASAPSSDPGANLTGTWQSPGCGARKYARELTLGADGTFNARDLVSPCPKDASCVWSGIVERKGTYASGAGRLTLSVSDAGKPAGEPLPGRLLYHAPDATLIEDPDHTNCVYTKAR